MNLVLLQLEVFGDRLRDPIRPRGAVRLEKNVSRGGGNTERRQSSDAQGEPKFQIKMSTLVQWAKIEAIDVRTGWIAFDKLFTFRGDTDEAWRRAEAFISDEITALPIP